MSAKRSRNNLYCRAVTARTSADAKKIMEDIGCDTGGVRLMEKKLGCVSIFVDGISHAPANIIKQQMLSVGGDCAVPRGAISGRMETDSALIIGDKRHFESLCHKLKGQPFSLAKLSQDIEQIIKNYEKSDWTIQCSGRKLHVSNSKPVVMGILNVTPDSFYDGAKHCDVKSAVEHGLHMSNAGAAIIDVGGESTRPGSAAVSSFVQKKRVVPVIKQLCKESNCTISCDTSSSVVARAAIDAGASIINDTSALSDSKMADVVAKSGAGVVLMHMKGKPKSMQRRPRYNDVVREVHEFLLSKVGVAIDAGISRDSIMIDPGIGFGKALEHNITLCKYLGDFKSLGLPVVFGSSRKSMLGKLSGKNVHERLISSIASAVVAARSGASIIRAHDVTQTVEALSISSAL